MRVLHYPADPLVRANTGLLMIPGAMQQPDDFIEAGFVRAIQHRRLPLDLHLASFEVEAVADITSTATLQQIQDGLIQPAISAGYTRIWLAGISMGALLALAHTDYYPGKVQGLCLLSPYPGNRLLQREIADAGGLDAWHSGEDSALATEFDAERRMWRCLQQRRIAGNAYFGYGSDDRFFEGLQQMAQNFPAATIDVIAGGHDWPTWEKLWCNFLDKTFTMQSA